MDAVRQAIQALLDANTTDPGWQVDQLVLVLGVERVRGDGGVDSGVWVIAPADQPAWQTNGLIDDARAQANAAAYDD